MQIAIVGTGNMGKGLGRAWAAAGHDVHVGSRDAARGQATASEIGAATGGSYAEAVAKADVVLFAVPWWGVDDAIDEMGDATNKVVIDTTNPYKDATYAEQDEFPGSSAGQKIQERIPGARVIKGWNHTYAQIVNSSPDFGGVAASVFLAGDDDEAKETVAQLARDIGYDPVDAGPISSAAYLERLAGLMVTMAYGLGRGTDQAMKLITR